MSNPKPVRASEMPSDVDWEELGPKLFKTLSDALQDHDEAYMKLPGFCIHECWSHEARELLNQ